MTAAPADTLLSRYDAFLLDLDGTVYRGGSAVDGAVPAIRSATDAGVAIRFVTNNASRTPADVARHLTDLAIPARPDQVTNSAQAAANLLSEHVSAGAEVLILGTDTLAAEATARGFTAVRVASPATAAVLQGLSQDLTWRDLAEATVAIRSGAIWVACNLDPTLPTERGQMPGNGSLVAAVRTATGAEPLVAGKPARPLMVDAIRAASARRPLAVGDRLDTDIAGGVNVGIDTLLVLTGVTRPVDVLSAPPAHRPTYLAADLLEAVSTPAVELAIASPHPDWSAEAAGAAHLRLRHHGAAAPHPLAALRTLCARHWETSEHTGSDNGPTIEPLDAAAKAALAELDLPTADS